MGCLSLESGGSGPLPGAAECPPRRTLPGGRLTRRNQAMSAGGPEHFGGACKPEARGGCQRISPQPDFLHSPQLHCPLLQVVAHGGFLGPLSEEGPERPNLLAHRPRVRPQPASLPTWALATGDSLGAPVLPETQTKLPTGCQGPLPDLPLPPPCARAGAWMQQGRDLDRRG